MRKASLVSLIALLFSLSPGLRAETIVDLNGRQLRKSPNPTVPRWGLMPGIIKVSEPVLLIEKTALPASRGTILLLPGGGYHALAIVHEGQLVADFLRKQGFDVAILEYSIATSSNVRGRALRDAEKAWNLLIKHGEELGLQTKPLGIIGFSAGGHLATRLTHILGRNYPPDFLALIYPAYLDEHSGLGGFDPAVTPPSGARTKVFVLIGDQDKPQWISGAKAYAEACRKNGQEVKFCLLPKTAHGFGMKPDRKGPSARWESKLKYFLESK